MRESDDKWPRKSGAFFIVPGAKSLKERKKKKGENKFLISGFLICFSANCFTIYKAALF
jgi:hypothetical protein